MMSFLSQNRCRSESTTALLLCPKKQQITSLLDQAHRAKNCTMFLFELLGVTDPELLFELKRYADTTDLCSLDAMIHEHPHIREELLAHFKKHMGTRRRLHVVSDIDDTIYASHLGGRDDSHKVNALYPGVVKMFAALTSESGFVTLLSARPKGTASETRSFLQGHIPEHTMWGTVSNLMKEGAVDKFKQIVHGHGGVGASGVDGFQHMAYKKAVRMKTLGLHYPEMDFVFVGDTGQGDMLTAQWILTKGFGISERVKAVLIHEVLTNGEDDSERPEPPSKTKTSHRYIPEQINILKERFSEKVWFFRSYQELAKTKFLQSVAIRLPDED